MMDIRSDQSSVISNHFVGENLTLIVNALSAVGALRALESVRYLLGSWIIVFMCFNGITVVTANFFTCACKSIVTIVRTTKAHLLSFYVVDSIDNS
jgi:hypothetical protein